MSLLMDWLNTPAYIYGLFIFIIIFAASSKALIGLLSTSAIVIGIVLAGFTVYWLYNQGILSGEARLVIEPIEEIGQYFPSGIPPDMGLLIATVAFVAGILYFLTSAYKNKGVSGKTIILPVIAGIVGCYFISPVFDPISAGLMYTAAFALLAVAALSYRRF